MVPHQCAKILFEMLLSFPYNWLPWYLIFMMIGIYIIFSAFWPQRILFFSAKQRRKFINGQVSIGKRKSPWLFISSFYKLISSFSYQQTMTCKNICGVFSSPVLTHDAQITIHYNWILKFLYVHCSLCFHFYCLVSDVVAGNRTFSSCSFN